MQTVRFKNELERNITIKLGYANAKIYKCEDERCPRPMSFKYVPVFRIFILISSVVFGVFATGCCGLCCDHFRAQNLLF